MNTIEGNTLFKKRASHLVTYEYGPSKIKLIFVCKEKPKEVFGR